jgi:outer membrane lipoprotein carrier protein
LLVLSGLSMFLRFQCLMSKFAVIISLSVLSLQVSAATEQASTLGLSKLVERLGKINTFSGAFVQESVDPKGRRIQESKGELKAQRPGLFYWHTKEPLEQVVYSNATHVTVYDPDLEQATIQKVSAQSKTTPAILFSGDVDRIGELFDVEYREVSATVAQFILTPKTKDSLFERLKIRFEGQHLKAMHLSDALGQVSSLSFIYSEVNLVFPDDTFVPNLPEGIDIIRDVPLASESVPSQELP